MPSRPILLSLACACAIAAAGVRAAPEADSLPQPAAAVGERGFVNHVRDAASDLVLSAMDFIGVRYRRGGTSETSGFDCSGFTRHVFERTLGLVLPRRAEQQAGDTALGKVERSELKPGDLVFFNTMRRAFSHVGIYVGDGKFIHSPRPGGEVRIEDMQQSYWVKRYNGARRALLGSGELAVDASLRQ